MKNIGHFHSPLWRLSAVIVSAVLLVSCGTSSPSEAVATTAAAATQAVVTVQATATIPPAGMGNIIPRPVSQVAAGGTFTISADTAIYVEPATDETKAIGQYLADRLSPATGYTLKIQSAGATPSKGSIFLTLNGAAASLGDEGYELTITPDLVKVAANKPAGLFYGIQTIRQLLPPAIESASSQPGPWTLPAGTITDYPRFSWRSTMLDVARHFFTVREVTRYIDLLAYYKINRLHLHLSDDQGWRIQINSWPNLAIYGGSLEIGGTPGGYYSQNDYSYIVNYAQSRYITIIPEIDMPGHTTAALASYAELNCNGVAPELFTGGAVGFSSLCVNKASTAAFLKDVIGELAALTPGPYIHIGGDEAQSTSQADYISFITQVQAIVKANGKQMVGWEEISQAQLLPDSIMQHWNPDQSDSWQAVQVAVKKAIKQGNKVIMSPADKAYMDMKYSAATTLGQDWAALISVEAAYYWDPAALVSGITEKNILGVESPLWSETLDTMSDVEYMAFPRLPGYAEMGWTPQTDRDWSSYRLRLATHGPRLTALGVHFYASPEIPWP